MFAVHYSGAVLLISLIWLTVRADIWLRNRRIDLKRESMLLLVYICLIVVARFTFFPFGKIDGRIQPLIFDAAAAFPPRINLIPFVHLMDYEHIGDALINLIGNTAMFIPIGIIWPLAYKKLNSHVKIMAAGFGFSLFIEILQLPFFDRVSDIDDLILNTLGFLIGYGIWLLIKRCRRKKHC